MQEKHKNILGIQHKTSAKFNIFVKIITVLYLYGICCCYIIFLCTLGNVLPFLYTLNKVENKMDILPYRGNHGHSTNKRFALKKPAELTNSTRRHLENLFRAKFSTQSRTSPMNLRGR